MSAPMQIVIVKPRISAGNPVTSNSLISQMKLATVAAADGLGRPSK